MPSFLDLDNSSFHQVFIKGQTATMHLRMQTYLGDLHQAWTQQSRVVASCRAGDCHLLTDANPLLAGQQPCASSHSAYIKLSVPGVPPSTNHQLDLIM
jgi:hypothetical protein